MNILVVSPHPDDETLGAGGTLLKMKKKGHNIFWLNITEVTEKLGWSKEYVAHRKEQIDQIVNCFKFDGFFDLSLEPTQLSRTDEGTIISRIKDVFDKVKPEWIIIPGAYDAHSDHRVVYNCCMAAAKSFRAQYLKRIMTMEIISETDYGFQNEKFEPNLFVDITDEIDNKIKAISIYDTELEEFPFPRSIENIRAHAMSWGGRCSCAYAEAFCVLKQIE